MNVLVLNGSPAGKNSITLQTVEYIEKHFADCAFNVLHVGQRIKSMEKDFAPCREALEAAELILFAYPVYTFLAPAQLHRFIELMKGSGVDFTGKYATQLTTSKHFYDTTAHRFIQDACDDMGLKYVRGLSADMEDLLSEEGRNDALAFFGYVRWNMENGLFEPPFYRPDKADLPALKTASPGEPRAKRRPGEAVIVADLSADAEGRLAAMIERFKNVYEYETRVVDLAEFPFSGGCLGCFHCAADGKCIYKDGFDDYLRNNIQSADAIVYAYTVKDHSMGTRFKLYDDRQFCNGHRTVTMGKPVGYLVDGALEPETNLKTLMEARAQVGGNFLAGIATDRHDPDADIDRMAKTLAWAVREHYCPPADFYGVGGMKIFRDLIYQMQGLMRADHKFYKAHGFYKDFPQKHRGKMVAMYAVGAMMTNEKMRKKAGAKMTEGMLMPYKAALKKAEKKEKK